MAFNMTCASNCGEVTLLPNATVCEIKQRVIAPKRFHFIPCDKNLPDPIKGAIKPLYDDNTIVVSSELANWDFGEPTFVESSVSAARPPDRLLTGRTITAEDRTALVVTSGSPATVDNYADYAFVKDKISKNGLYYVATEMSNGDVFLPKDDNNNLIRANVTAWITYDVIDTASNYTVEVKNISITYQGDPMAFNHPDYNMFEEGITV